MILTSLRPDVGLAWRTDRDLQVGPRHVLRWAPAGADAALRLLGAGRDLGSVAARTGVSPQWLRYAIGALGRAGLLADPPTGSVHLSGDGPLADRIALALASGCQLVRSTGPVPGCDVTVVAPPTAGCDRVLLADLMRDDRPHVAVTATAGGCVVGPFVDPGASACHRCCDLTLAGRDPAWPRVAAQLAATEVRPDEAAAAWAAGLVARHVAAFLAGVDPPSLGRSWELVGPDQVVRDWPLHPDCGCVTWHQPALRIA